MLSGHAQMRTRVLPNYRQRFLLSPFLQSLKKGTTEIEKNIQFNPLNCVLSGVWRGERKQKKTRTTNQNYYTNLQNVINLQCQLMNLQLIFNMLILFLFPFELLPVEMLTHLTIIIST